MKSFTIKTLATTIITSSLLIGCAATDPNTPQSNNDFVYNPKMSFAMNVVDGSLDLHTGLQDAKVPEGADASAGALDYAADGIIGAALGGGLGGAFLSMLGTNQGNAPLNGKYVLVYYPVSKKGNVQSVFDQIEQEWITTAESKRELNFVKKHKIKNSKKTFLSFKGEDCNTYSQVWGFEESDTCNFISYYPPKLIKYATVTPSGEKGLFAVVGYENTFAATHLTLDLDKKYYTFSPASKGRTKFPYVVHNNEVSFFVKPDYESGKNDSISIEQLMAIDPWVNKHYGAIK